MNFLLLFFIFYVLNVIFFMDHMKTTARGFQNRAWSFPFSLCHFHLDIIFTLNHVIIGTRMLWVWVCDFYQVIVSRGRYTFILFIWDNFDVFLHIIKVLFLHYIVFLLKYMEFISEMFFFKDSIIFV